jgi:serine/threonine-protein kinase
MVGSGSGSAAPDVATGSGSADQAVVAPDTTQPDANADSTKTKADLTKSTKIDATKPEPTKAKPRTDKPKPDRPRAVVAKVDAKVDKPKPDKQRVDVEAAYRAGIQQFAHGDTSGALTSLRTSLAGNPNYAPTWRGLGLVFERMGEKDQARAAFKRYLQLSPNAPDAEQIRGRLERLGS